MVNFTQSDIDFINEYFDNPKSILNMSSPRAVLIALYELIDEKGFAPPHYEDYNDFGREAQKVYDRIFLNNPD